MPGCALMGLDTLDRLELKKQDLVRVRSEALSINGTSIQVLGSIFLKISGSDSATEQVVETAAQVRVSAGVKNLFLSK